MLLDESLPHDMVPEIVGHEVDTVQGRGWTGTKNGALLALAVPEFDVFITGDRNLPHQQNLALFHIRVVILAAPRNRIDEIRPLLPQLLEAIESAKPREATWVAA